MTQPCKPRRGLRPAGPVCAPRRCRPSFLDGKDAPLPLCRGFAVLRSFCETFAFLCYARLRHKSTEYIIIHSVQKGNPPPSKSVFLRSTKRPAAAYPRNRRADVSSFWLEIFGTKFLFSLTSTLQAAQKFSPQGASPANTQKEPLRTIPAGAPFSATIFEKAPA